MTDDRKEFLKEHYLSGGHFSKKLGRFEYEPKFFSFDKYELEIDFEETMEEVELYSPNRQRAEIVKCANSFFYFCHKYVKILHPMRGLIPFVLFNYQRTVIKNYEKNRFNIISKFRQGGITTVSLLWGLWKCMFQNDQQIMLLSKTDREATDIGLIVDRACENLPSWLRPIKDAKWNDHLKMFTDTGSALKFYSPEAARGKSVTFLILDEAAFIVDMDKHWKAMWPILSTGGSCAVISTVNGTGNWYEETYHKAQEKDNRFNVIDLDYWEHPDYTEEWAEEQKSQLGERGFAQEVLREFLGSGETYFSRNIIVKLAEETKNNIPSRKLFPKWANTIGRIAQMEAEHSEKGALWIWKEPREGREYIIGADAAEGQGENNDNSCFQVLDMNSLEQVAEFYSNTIVPHEFAQVLNQVGIFYNNALLVVENMGPGGAVLSNLQHTLFYENLHYDSTAKAINPKPGVKMGMTNRPLYLESIQNRLINQTVKINSLRFVLELETFQYNKVRKKAEAQKGKHDDAILSLCLALYTRDTLMRDVPVGADGPKENVSILNAQVYEEIKRELMEGKDNDLLSDANIIDHLAKDDEYNNEFLSKYRRKDKLLREFGWVVFLPIWFSFL